MTAAAAHTRPIRLALLHPQRTWAETVESLLGSRYDVDVVIAHTDWNWVCGAVSRGDVDVVLVSLGDGGFEPSHVERLKAACPSLAVMVVSEPGDPDLVTAAVRAGARGWLSPATSARELVQGLRAVTIGETWLPPLLTSAVLDRLLTQERVRVQSQSSVARLSPRELEILNCLAAGMTRREIGESFQLSQHTVRTHINHILRKLGVHSTLAAVSIVNKARVPGQSV
jgi:DNA-binding NarL/FixJ family response regulator